MSTDKFEKAVTLYPAYMDATKTWKGGRRIPKAQAVVAPDCREIHDVLVDGLRLEAKLELNKSYSRDWVTPGRVRVSFKDDKGNAQRPDIPTKQALIAKCAELCAKHPHREARLAEMKRFEESICATRSAVASGGKHAAAKAGSSTQATTSKGTNKSNKKKGKKK
eukprot:jgi/Ulvmu1/5226/UM022_0019.1